MQIGFQPPYRWQELNEQASQLLGLTEKGGAVQIYAGLGAALSELSIALAKQFPHKKKVFYFKGFDPSYESAATLLSREGCMMKGLDLDLLSQREALDAAIESDALFVICSEDDPLLGRLLDLTHLEAVTETKRVTLIRISHAHHRYLPLPDTFTRQKLRIHSLGARLALIFYSARMRWPSQFAENVALTADALNEIEKLKTQDLVNPSAVEKIEALKPAGSNRLFMPDSSRIPDRAILWWSDLDGLSMIEGLARRLNYQLPPPGESTKLETTSLNRWRGVRTMDWLRPLGFTDEMIRGTVIFDHRCLDDELVTHIEATAQEIRKIQFG